MADVFGKVLELSWQAGLIALAVMAVRFLLRGRVARRWLCLLWALVALRLVLPVSLTVESSMSLQAAEAPVSQAYHEMQRTTKASAPAVQAIPTQTAAASAADAPSLADALPWLWLAGMGCMLLYMAASLLWMRLSLRQAVRVKGNIYRCGRWRTPFVLGILAPRIYVPETVAEKDLPLVQAHERCHIRRWDHVWKPLAFVLLAVNWFHPVLWAAYALLGRDMENACDEMALQHADAAQRAAYSRALVSCAVQPRMAAVCPLAFGEVAVKERVNNVINKKSSAVWAVVVLLIAAAAIGACLLTKPSKWKLPDAQTLYALRTENVHDQAAVDAILEALDMRELGGGSTIENTDETATYTYYSELGQKEGATGITVRHIFNELLGSWDRNKNAEMHLRGYLALALIDGAEWLEWQAWEPYLKGPTEMGGFWMPIMYADTYRQEIDAARQSAEGLRAFIDLLEREKKAGTLESEWRWAEMGVDRNPLWINDDGAEIPWDLLVSGHICCVSAEEYDIVYDQAHLPDWDTVPLAYLCAYYLNADGIYAQQAMETLTARYRQMPEVVLGYCKTLTGMADPQGRGDAAAVLQQLLLQTGTNG